MLTSNNITEGQGAPPPGAQMARKYDDGVQKRRPVHPGSLVRSDLEALGMSVNQAAIKIGVSRAALNNLVNEQAAVSAEMALRLGRFFRNGPQLWIKLQNEVDLWNAKQAKGKEIDVIEPSDWEGREEFD